jgi:phosphatidylinositol alpha-1,6-mannosyltransferase
MKKLLFATLEFPPVRGGIAEYVYGLCSALPPDKVTVLADEAGEPPRSEFRVIRKRLLRRGGLPLRWLRAIPIVLKALREEKAGVLAVTEVLPMGTVAWLIKAVRGTPYVVFVHGTDVNYASRFRWRRFLMRRILKDASLVVANSGYTRSLAEAAGAVPGRSIIIYPCPAVGHHHAETRASARQRFGFDRRLVLLSVGRMVRRKGFDRVIGILPQLRRMCGDVVYVVVGNGGEKAALDEQAKRHGVEPFVMLRSEVDREALGGYFVAADLFILPARRLRGDVEGFGIVLVEAGLHGVPIVATRVGGIPEAVVDGQTGLLLPEDIDDEALIDAVGNLLHAPVTRQRMGEAARVRSAEFSWQRQAEKLMSALETV